MSKAFTKEDDDAPPPVARRHALAVPQDVPNYMTAAGAVALRAELEALRAADERDEVRVRELADHLATAQLVEPAPGDRVQFGSTVTVEDEAGQRTRYQLVGVIEADPRHGHLSWRSPLGRVLLGAQVGDVVAAGRGEIEVVAIE